jgi:hypothetical protein
MAAVWPPPLTIRVLDALVTIEPVGSKFSSYFVEGHVHVVIAPQSHMVGESEVAQNH